MTQQDSEKTSAGGLQTFVANLASIICLVAFLALNGLIIIVTSWIYLLPNTLVPLAFQNHLIYFEIGIVVASIIIGLLVAFGMSIFPILRRLVPGDHAVEQMATFNGHLSEGVIKALNDTIEKCKAITENLDEVLFFQTITDRKDGYRLRVLNARAEVEKKVPHPPIYLTNFAEKLDHDVYHKHEIEYCDKHPNVEAYKIITLSDRKKFDTYREICRQAKKGYRVDEAGKILYDDKGQPVKKDPLTNLHIACLCSLDEQGQMNLDGLLSTKTNLPKIFGVQVIDDDEVILLDPKCAVYDPAGNGKNPVCIKNKAVAQLFIGYYEQLWAVLKAGSKSQSVLDNGFGMIIYESGLDEEVMETRLQIIENSLPSNQSSIIVPNSLPQTST